MPTTKKTRCTSCIGVVQCQIHGPHQIHVSADKVKDVSVYWMSNKLQPARPKLRR